MPYLSKRKRQLQGARNAKRRKSEDDDLQREQQNGEEEQNERGSLPSVESSQNDEDEASSEEPEASDIDNDELIEVYACEWMAGLDRDDLMSLTITFHHLLVSKLKLKLTDASKLIAELTGKGERTNRLWRAQFIANEGSFPDSLQGKYQRSGVLWQNKEMNKVATCYVRENKVVKGRPNMILQSFAVVYSTGESNSPSQSWARTQISSESML